MTNENLHANNFVYLYYSRNQKCFHIFEPHANRHCADDWKYLCRDEYNKIIDFLKDKRSESAFKLNAWEAEDFYSDWSKKKYGQTHWDRLDNLQLL